MTEPDHENVIRACYVDDSAVDLASIEKLTSGAVFLQTADCIDDITPERYDVVLLDLGLQDTSGLDTLRAYIDKFGDAVPVIVLSGADDDMTRRQAIRLGAADFIPKGTITDIGPLMRILERVVLQNHKRRTVFNEFLLGQVQGLQASVKEYCG